MLRELPAAVGRKFVLTISFAAALLPAAARTIMTCQSDVGFAVQQFSSKSC